MQSHALMRVVSVNVGLPREVLWKRRTVLTGIFKEPVAGRVMARRLNLDGDRQADLSLHGGPEKAIYVYPADYYHAWREELPEMDLPWAIDFIPIKGWGTKDQDEDESYVRHNRFP